MLNYQRVNCQKKKRLQPPSNSQAPGAPGIGGDVGTHITCLCLDDRQRGQRATTMGLLHWGIERWYGDTKEISPGYVCVCKCGVNIYVYIYIYMQT